MRVSARRLLPVLALLALCAGCGGPPGIGRLEASSVLVAFGDSLTSGVGAPKAESYPARLSEILGCRVVNAGKPGEETREGLARLPAVLRRHEPDLVVLCHGGNDMLRKRDPAVIRRNLRAMVSLAKQAGADVVLVAVPRPGLLLKVPPLYRQVAEEHEVPLESGALREILRTPSLKSDRIHPNAAGYRRMAEAIARLVRRNEGA